PRNPCTGLLVQRLLRARGRAQRPEHRHGAARRRPRPGRGSHRPAAACTLLAGTGDDARRVRVLNLCRRPSMNDDTRNDATMKRIINIDDIALHPRPPEFSPDDPATDYKHAARMGMIRTPLS